MNEKDELERQRKLISKDFRKRMQRRGERPVLDDDAELARQRRLISGEPEPARGKREPSRGIPKAVKEEKREFGIVKCSLMRPMLRGEGVMLDYFTRVHAEVENPDWRHSDAMSALIGEFGNFFAARPVVALPDSFVPRLRLVLGTARRNGFRFLIDSIWFDSEYQCHVRIRSDIQGESVQNMPHPTILRLFSPLAGIPPVEGATVPGGKSRRGERRISVVLELVTGRDMPKGVVPGDGMCKMPVRRLGGILVSTPEILDGRISDVLDRFASAGISLDGLSSIGMRLDSDGYADRELAGSVVLKSLWSRCSGNGWILDKVLGEIDVSGICWACGCDSTPADGICAECRRKALGDERGVMEEDGLDENPHEPDADWCWPGIHSCGSGIPGDCGILDE